MELQQDFCTEKVFPFMKRAAMMMCSASFCTIVPYFAKQVSTQRPIAIVARPVTRHAKAEKSTTKRARLETTGTQCMDTVSLLIL